MLRPYEYICKTEIHPSSQITHPGITYYLLPFDFAQGDAYYRGARRTSCYSERLYFQLAMVNVG